MVSQHSLSNPRPSLDAHFSPIIVFTDLFMILEIELSLLVSFWNLFDCDES